MEKKEKREKKTTVSFSNPITTLNTVSVVCTIYVMVPAVSMDPGSVPYSIRYKKKDKKINGSRSEQTHTSTVMYLSSASITGPIPYPVPLPKEKEIEED